MKNTLLFLLTGIILGASAYHFHLRPRPVAAPAATLTERARLATAETEAAVSTVLADWKLNPADLRNDLARTGAVVRQKSPADRERVSDARIVAIIKGKYIVDEDLAAAAIKIESTEGRVTLAGGVASHEALSTALRLALETEGVREVKAQVAVTETT